MARGWVAECGELPPTSTWHSHRGPSGHTRVRGRRPRLQPRQPPQPGNTAGSSDPPAVSATPTPATRASRGAQATLPHSGNAGGPGQPGDGIAVGTSGPPATGTAEARQPVIQRADGYSSMGVLRTVDARASCPTEARVATERPTMAFPGQPGFQPPAIDLATPRVHRRNAAATDTRCIDCRRRPGVGAGGLRAVAGLAVWRPLRGRRLRADRVGGVSSRQALGVPAPHSALLPGRLDQPVVAVAALVDDAHLVRVRSH